MDTYSIMREFADSWMLLFMFTFFIGIVLWVLFSKRGKYNDTANIIFRHDDKPLTDDSADEERGKEART